MNLSSIDQRGPDEQIQIALNTPNPFGFFKYIWLYVSDYESMINGPDENIREIMLIMVGTTGEGFYWSNTKLKKMGREPLYCGSIKIPLHEINTNVF